MAKLATARSKSAAVFATKLAAVGEANSAVDDANKAASGTISDDAATAMWAAVDENANAEVPTAEDIDYAVHPSALLEVR